MIEDFICSYNAGWSYPGNYVLYTTPMYKYPLLSTQSTSHSVSLHPPLGPLTFLTISKSAPSAVIGILNRLSTGLLSLRRAFYVREKKYPLQ